jgi:hypothetical protein
VREFVVQALFRRHYSSAHRRADPLKGNFFRTWATQILAADPEVKPVFMSGYTGELIAQQSNIKQDVPLLEKPFTRAELWKILDEVLG